MMELEALDTAETPVQSALAAIGKEIAKVDANEDKRISLEEVVGYLYDKVKDKLVKSLKLDEKNSSWWVAREYVILYVTFIATFIGFSRPEEFTVDAWTPILWFALLALIAIFGGFLKATFQKQFQKQEFEIESMKATLDANKEALNRSVNREATLKAEADGKDKEIVFWKKQYEDLKNKEAV